MNIQRVRIKHFYSILDIDFKIGEYKGLVEVIGINEDTGGSNGAGKSALFEAVVWGLFGRTIRKSTEAAICNNLSGKGCSVVITIENGNNSKIRIERSKKPTSLKLYLNEVEITREAAKFTQAHIEKILNISYKTFLASTIFGQHNKIRFLDSSLDEKREIIRRFLDLEYIFSMRDKIKKSKQFAREKVVKEETLYNEYCKQKKGLEKKLKDITDIVEVKEDLDTLLIQQTKADTIDSQLSNLRSYRSRFTQDLVTVKKNIVRLPKEFEPSCSKCGQEIDKFVKLDFLEKEAIEIAEELETIRVAINKRTKERDKYPKDIDSLIFFKKAELASGEKVFYKESLIEIKEIIDKHLQGKLLAQKELDIAAFWDKAFSEKGLVKYIIRNILDYLNESVNYYLSYLTQSNFSLKFDDELNEIITQNGNIVHYISLSGGEKRKVNLAVMLGLQRIVFLTSKDKCNFILFDEVAENIDPTGLEGLSRLFQDLKKERTVFIITHNKELEAVLNASSSIIIVKKKDVSVIK